MAAVKADGEELGFQRLNTEAGTVGEKVRNGTG